MNPKIIGAALVALAGLAAAAYIAVGGKKDSRGDGGGERSAAKPLDETPLFDEPKPVVEPVEKPDLLARAAEVVKKAFKDDGAGMQNTAPKTRRAAGADSAKQQHDYVGEFFAGMLGIAQFPTRYDEMIKRAADENNISAKVLKSLLISESSLNPDAVGSAGERGLAQFMKETWEEETGLPHHRAHEPRLAIQAAAVYLKKLLDAFRGEYRIAIAAYNGGWGNADRGTLPARSWGYADKILRRVNADNGLPDGI